MNGPQLGAAAGAGAGEPDRGDEVDLLAFETVFGVWSDDPENALCVVCSDPLDLNELPDPNSRLCPDCGGPADHHDRRIEMPDEIIEWTDSHGQIHHLQHRPGDEVTWDMPTPSGVHYETRAKVTGYDLNDEVTPYEVTVLELADDYDPDTEPHDYQYAVGEELMATAFDMGDSPIEEENPDA